MAKPLIISIVIVLVCALENISHYFGFCFHGWMSHIIAGLSAFGFSIILYLTNIIHWLNPKQKHTNPHRCKHKHFHTEEKP